MSPGNAERRPSARSAARQNTSSGSTIQPDARLRRPAPPASPDLPVLGPEATASDPARELRAWLAAVEHLHSRGLPAATPEFVAAWLSRRGITADWTWAA
jgi:hypothetical protein